MIAKFPKLTEFEVHPEIERKTAGLWSSPVKNDDDNDNSDEQEVLTLVESISEVLNSKQNIKIVRFKDASELG
jgi:hypothetical protein